MRCSLGKTATNTLFATRKPIHPHLKLPLFPTSVCARLSEGQQQDNKVLRIGKGKQIYCCLLQFFSPKAPTQRSSNCVFNLSNFYQHTGYRNSVWEVEAHVEGGKVSQIRQRRDNGRSWGKIVLLSECSRAWRMNMLIFIFTLCSALQGRTHCSCSITVGTALHKSKGILLCPVICHLMIHAKLQQCPGHYKHIGYHW